MQIILLSGGSGTRLWPLSNDARSKQFLRLLPVEGTDRRESMIQRVVRQVREAGLDASLTVATSASQKDSVVSQIGDIADIVTEPMRRDTFPAICLACKYLEKVKGCTADEVVVVMPCDPYTESGYFEAIGRMAQGIEAGYADMMVMGINPTYPSAKYGYVVPEGEEIADGITAVERFTEKPTVEVAARLIEQGALWNGGVFAFRLGYMTSIADRYLSLPTFNDYIAHYGEFPKISFDYEVAEKADSIAMVRYGGSWKDLGTWNTLTDEIASTEYGNVVTDGTSVNTHLFNELNIPMLCLGTENLVVAASPDGIIISEKSKSENIKHYASQLKQRPMFEERRWGSYTVIDNIDFSDGHSALAKQVNLNAGGEISYHRHNRRSEIWTILDGEGEVTVEGCTRKITRGDIVTVERGKYHSLRAITALTFIEIQQGETLIEEDIERK